MHRRNEIDWALPSMTPKAVADTPLELRARQCQADADVEAAAAIVAPTNIAMRKRLMMPPCFMNCDTASAPQFS
jgi:hypothetical protein